MTNGMRFLLGDIDAPEFFRSVWTRSSLHVPGPSEKFETILTWAEFGNALTAFRSGFTQQTFRVIRNREIVPFHRFSSVDGKAKDPVRTISRAKVEELCRGGATLVVRGVDALTDGLQRLSQRLRSEMQCVITANAYYSHTAEQGFDAHFDTHEVFVLQVEGSKSWHLGGVTYPFPGENDQSSDHPGPDHYDKVITTKRGECLYIPRGVWHYAEAADEPSLHVTIGIRPLTGVDVLGRAVAWAAETPEFRKALGQWRNDRFEYDAAAIGDCLDAFGSQFLTAESAERICSQANARRDVNAVDSFVLPFHTES